MSSIGKYARAKSSSRRPRHDWRVCVFGVVVVLAFTVKPVKASFHLWHFLLWHIDWLNNIFGPAQYGGYPTSHVVYHLPDILDSSLPSAEIVFPTMLRWPGSTVKFPLVVFSHGDFGGGPGTYWGHTALLNGLASFGFIVVAPASCPLLWCNSGEGLENYYQEQLKLIDWASSDSRDEDSLGILKSVKRDNGYGLTGHSSGGAAVVIASDQFAEYNVTVAVLLHPGSGGEYKSSTPLAAFTGTVEGCCGENTTKTYYLEADPPKAYANMIGANHLEPILFRSRWTAYAAAWFKIWIAEGDKNFEYYYDLIYGDSQLSLCKKYPMLDDCEALE